VKSNISSQDRTHSSSTKEQQQMREKRFSMKIRYKEEQPPRKNKKFEEN